MQNKTKSKEGFRTYRKKMAAMLLVGMLAVSTAATGCGKKDVDYDVDGNGGIYAYIRHPNGWTSCYLHIQQ